MPTNSAIPCTDRAQRGCPAWSASFLMEYQYKIQLAIGGFSRYTNTISNLNYLSLNWKAPPFGVADYVIFDLENHIIPSHIDLHIKNFNAAP